MRYKDITLPIHSNANDPWVIRHEGRYYYCWSDGRVNVREISGLDDIRNENGNIVWEPVPGTSYAAEVWAPELHYINGEWYIYVACDDGKNENHRMYVLKGSSQNPTDPFTFIGQIGTSDDHWAIDGTVLSYKGELYFVWSGWQGRKDGQQDLFIAHMPDPMHVDSERVLISSPTLSWERNAMPINEGPVALTDGDSVCLVYSASGSWTDDYCLGMITLQGGNPMNPEDWHKCPVPLLTKAPGAYGPGHCSFTTAPDNSLWVIYHANSVAGSSWPGRNCRAQKVLAHSGTSLTLGRALSAGETIKIPVTD